LDLPVLPVHYHPVLRRVLHLSQKD
jgi:hypothetical protein